MRNEIIAIALEDMSPTGLGMAVEIVEAICGSCQQVKSNKEQCLLLSNRCQRLMEVIRDHYDAMDSNRLGHAMETTIRNLSDIRESMSVWQSMTRIESFVKQKDIAEDIKSKLQGLDDCITLFQISSQLQINDWAQDFKEARESDSEILSQMLKNQEDFRQMQLELMHTATGIRGEMKQLQLKLRCEPAGTMVRAQTEQRLLVAQKVSGFNLPISELDGECEKIGQRAVAGSGVYDIFEGRYLGEWRVALKVLRGSVIAQAKEKNSHKPERRFRRQAEIWSQLDNPHILPLFGYCTVDGPFPYLVSPWLKNGSAPRYLGKNPDADRLKFCLEMAYGLRYLHTLQDPIIHGCLQGSNVLISDDITAMLADFGLSKVLGSQFTQSNGQEAAYRWMAPEIQNQDLTQACDIYSWAMTSLELLSGKVPFHTTKLPGQVLLKVVRGEHPSRSEYDCTIDDRMWALFERCWSSDPKARPTIQEVISEVETIRAN
ncbi:hypothetical protein BOTBODRAFT_38152 [Botryobasidium botryosum FD-172 SS1]|uniref:Protein kinase domain-containing protein n=1 Tax=Botryobasidium botryosum (strain FD-172 SS1) TaxID=930990 RepID=A0A067M990_BOTB1|nr:hypothetical protein BOTBODRAFT_38152 [Botryobasidium botryosum FD-172 SS1]